MPLSARCRSPFDTALEGWQDADRVWSRWDGFLAAPAPPSADRERPWHR
jgi:hypothetical protein